MTPTELISALEKATGPDRRLDFELWCALTKPSGFPALSEPKENRERWFETWKHTDAIPLYSVSIDAALTMVRPGHSAEIQTAAGDQPAIAELHAYESAEAPSMGGGKYFRWRHLGQVTHPTSAAIALCIAVLKARGDRR